MGRKKKRFSTRKNKRRSRRSSDNRKKFFYLPVDLVDQIMNYMNPKKVVSLSIVCKDWRAIAEERNPTFTRSPWLLLSAKKPSATWHLTQVANADINFKIKIKGFQHARCIGSSDGWLGFRDEGMDKKMCLLNPFTRARVQLPAAKDTHFNIACLSSSPLLAGCTVVAIGDRGKIYQWSLGTEDWTTLQEEGSWVDAICFRGQIFAFHSTGMLTCGEIHNHKQGEITWIPPPNNYWQIWLFCNQAYLVEFLGQVLLIFLCYRGTSELGYPNYNVHVFQVNKQNLAWTKIESLGDQAVFLRRYSSFTVSAKEMGCNANCIYFIDPSSSSNNIAWHVYDMESRSMKICAKPKQLPRRTANHFWITPSIL